MPLDVPLARTRLIRTHALSEPVIATAAADGSGPVAFAAPRNSRDALTILRLSASLNSIPRDVGPVCSITCPNGFDIQNNVQ